MDRCKSKWEGDYGDIPCRLYEGHGGPHESEWQKFASGLQSQERWMPIHESEKRTCGEVHPGQDVYHPEGH